MLHGNIFFFSCSGHGTCVSIAQMARMSNALPLGPNTYYEGDEVTIVFELIHYLE